MEEVLDLEGFLFKCSDLYPFDTKDSDRVKRLLDEYKDSIEYFVNKTNKRYNYSKLFRIIKEKYKYNKMPGIDFILEKLPAAIDIPNDYGATDQQVLVVILGKKDEKGNWSYKEQNYVMCNQGGGRYVGGILSELRQQYNMVKEFTFPKGSTTPYHDRERKEFTIYCPTGKIGKFGYPVDEQRVIYSYG